MKLKPQDQTPGPGAMIATLKYVAIAAIIYAALILWLCS